MRIAVCAKQVPDPDIPPSQFKIDASGTSVSSPAGVSPVVNGFDLNAVEAALQIKENTGGESSVTIVSVGTDFALDVMKKPLAMGADKLLLVDDPAADGLDAWGTMRALEALLTRGEPYDLILCGRQASDWDQAHVPLLLAEALGLPCVTVARDIQATGASVTVERVIADGFQVIEAPMPALITITNEYGEPRYPTLRGIMAAGRAQPEIFSLADLGLSADALAPRLRLVGLTRPESKGQVEFIDGEDDAEKGRNLALRLREENLI